MNQHEEKAALQKIPILAELNDSEYEDFFSSLKRCVFKKNEFIMTDGEVSDSMYFFLSGEAEVSKTLTLKTDEKSFSDAEKSFVKLTPLKSQFFGDMALFENDKRSASIKALCDCILYEMNRANFSNFIEKNPNAGVKVLCHIAKVLCTRIRKSNNDVLKLSTALSIALSK